MICPSPQRRKMFLWSLWQCRLRCSESTQAHTPSVYRADIHCAKDRPWEQTMLCHTGILYACLGVEAVLGPAMHQFAERAEMGRWPLQKQNARPLKKLPIGGSVNLCCQKVVPLIAFISHNLKSVSEYFVVSFLMKIIWRHLTLAVRSEFWWT